MFNDYNVRVNANPQMNMENAFSINAVSGALIKRHPKSRFVVVPMEQSESIFDPSNPTIAWGKKKSTKTFAEDDYSHRDFGGRPMKRYVEREVDIADMKSVVVLQAMILPENKLLCEVVLEEDFLP